MSNYEFEDKEKNDNLRFYIPPILMQRSLPLPVWKKFMYSLATVGLIIIISIWAGLFIKSIIEAKPVSLTNEQAEMVESQLVLKDCLNEMMSNISISSNSTKVNTVGEALAEEIKASSIPLHFESGAGILMNDCLNRKGYKVTVKAQ